MKTYDQEVDTIDGSKMIKHGNDAPAWMVTYADLMSLLFALFVLILSFSEVNDQSFKKNAGPMREAFNQNADFETDQESTLSGGQGILKGVKSIPINVPDQEALQEAMVENLRRSLQADLANKLVELVETKNGVIVRFPSETAFQPGGAELAPTAYASLDKIIPVLARTPGDIKVGGHTDNLPISTSQYRSNWDLSSARATSVIHYFLRSGQIPQKRLTSQGYAASRPLYENITPEARAANRRVEIAIEIPDDTEEAAKILEKQQPRRRIWTIEKGQKQLLPGVEAQDQLERRQRMKENAQ
ncbi:OmpA family protein [Terasakiella sp. A23]|uniref:OmpA family protein n=1 Tax=Terasakiella sp. FCG-A23 TaxID=3080561 RepID=UPI0029552DFE|nr:OmpA family protein [Terasakiella sp. A23]MDV7341123.1 OmpA family protein [Terasakiella sp. A23]